jgi:hypothetical protein
MIKSSSEGRQGLNHAYEHKMNEVPQIISTVDEACTFISRWFGWKDNLAGPQITLPFTVPRAIETVNRRLGRLWLEDRQAHGEIDIFGSQDSLISPHQYQARPDGIVPMIWENQGIWGCGFKPEMGAQLWVTGDWPDDDSGSRESDDEDEKPAGADRLLWTFAPWAGFRGFWTNNDQTLIRIQGLGWGVAARK